jgi:anti-sigma regulatory factor (Ser/Thr protein kinase)
MSVAHLGVSEPVEHDGPAYQHALLLWKSEAEFISATTSFVRDGLARGEPVLVATVPQRLAALRESLGTSARRVRFVDMTQLGANPARIIPAWLDFLFACGGRPARGVGEPLWAGRRPAETSECQLHEALLNLAVDSGTPFELLCPYDVSGLSAEVIAEAYRSHSLVVSADGVLAPTGGTDDQAHALDVFTHPLPRPPAHAEARAFASVDLRSVRTRVERRAVSAGVDRDRAADLGLAAYELCANSVKHGGGRGSMSIWRTVDALLVQVDDSGRCDDPLVGRRPVDGADSSGRGLWMVNQLCDLVQLRSGASGTTARLHTWLQRA